MILWERPLVLLFLVGVGLVLALGRRRSGKRWRIATGLRALTLGLLVSALAGPVLRLPAPGTRVLFLVDRSLSITPMGRQFEEAVLREAALRRGPADSMGIVSFGGTPVLVAPLSTREVRTDPGTVPDPDATDIASAIDLGLRVLGTDGARRLVILSDGEATQGDAVAAARVAASSGVTIDAVPVPREDGPEVLVDSVVAPGTVRPGERFDVRVVLRATASAHADIVLRRDGAVVARQRREVSPGALSVSFADRATGPGVLRYDVDVEATPDTLSGNNHGAAVVVVRGRPRVLFVARSPTRLPAWLAGQQVSVAVRPPDAVPSRLADLAPYDAVVLDDIPAPDLARAQQEALGAFVGRMGGGLVSIGGPHSYGVGGYAGTPLEEILPLRMDVRERATLPTVAIVLVIDTSGSMEAFGAELAKEELAKEIASSVIDHLGPHDQIGVLSFDQEYRWLVPLTEARHRARILGEVARLRAGGGTVMYPALAEALRALRASPAKLRHVIVLSDGLTDPGDFRHLAAAMAEQKITLSTVAIGSDADVGFMRHLAEWGGGRSYVAKDLYSIPEIFTTEAFLAVRSYIVEGPTPVQRAGGGAPTLQGLPLPPPVEGYVATVAKPRADVALQSPRRDPLLATWHYGAGRVVAFTSDDGLRWTTPWAAWRGVGRFWSQAVRWTLRAEGRGLYLLASTEHGIGKAVLEARHPDGSPWDGLALRGEVTFPSGSRQALVFDQTAPGRYEAAWEGRHPGVYTLVVGAEGPEGRVGTQTLGVVVPYSPELRPTGGGPALLAQLVETTGGRFLRDPRDAFRAGRGTVPQEAWPVLASAALAALVADVGVRRLPALGQQLALLGVRLGRFLGDPARGRDQRLREDRAYESADRWAAPPPGAGSMSEAARVYISRLRRGQ